MILPGPVYSTLGAGLFDIGGRSIRHWGPVYSTLGAGLFDIGGRSIRHWGPEIRHKSLLHNTLFYGNSLTL
jgi:hypothetical protein